MKNAIKNLKKNKAPDPDNILAEHLIEGGDIVITWMMGILNAIVELECVPDSLKCGNIIPVYKGGGKDPMKVESCRDITISSVFTKELEFLVLERLNMIWRQIFLIQTRQHTEGEYLVLMPYWRHRT